MLMTDHRAAATRAMQHAKMFAALPMLIAALVSDQRTIIELDVDRWYEITAPACSRSRALLWMLARHPEFRTLYYYRLRRGNPAGAGAGWILAFLYRGERTLHLVSSEIGPGLFIQHGFATIVAARRVGANCWINQQVTIGFDNPTDRPVIGDGVFVHAGAKVLGNVTIGAGARIGANAVVLSDVPAGYTAVGVPARLLPPKSQRPG
jgi:serine O-acetyltransferase